MCRSALAEKALSVVLVVGLVAICAALSSAQPEDGYVFKDEGAAAGWRFSGRAFKVDGWLPGPCAQPIVVSPNRQRVAFAATSWSRRMRQQIPVGESAVGCDHVAVDGRPQKHYEEVSAPVFSSDSKRVAYPAVEGEQCFVVLDGREGERYPGYIYGVIFSPDSKRYAYACEDLDRATLVLDGAALATHDSIDDYSLTFSPDSRRFAYAA
ncbi:MAG: hypothetical protein ACYTAN_14910, partial [Planctomycetota bacterium]